MLTQGVPETSFYTDDAKLVADILKDEWGLDMDVPDSITYVPESFMMNARVGSIFVYSVSTPFRIATTDYATLNKTSHVSIRVSNRFRENHFRWCNEVIRIILANRRAGPVILNGYEYMEMTNFRPNQDQSAWYTSTIEVRLVHPHVAIQSAGFGNKVNESIEKCISSDKDTPVREPCDCRRNRQ